MPTRSELRDLVRVSTLVEADDLTDSKVNNLMNQAVRDVSSRFDWPFLATSDTIAVTNATDTYALPTDADRLEAVLIAGSTAPLIEVSPGTAFAQDGAVPSSGTPSWYFLWGGNLVLRPQPDGDSTLTVYYYRKPATLDNDIDEPEWADKFHYLISDFVMSKLWEREEDFQRASVYEARYLQGIEAMARFYLNRVSDAPLIVGEPKSRRYGTGPRMTWLEV